MHIAPTLNWKTQFEKLRMKLIKSIGKLMSISLKFQETTMYYNLYDCGITTSNLKEEKELRRIYETPILIKLGFSNKFPRDIMCISKDILELELFLPSTMIAIQAIRMYLGDK